MEWGKDRPCLCPKELENLDSPRASRDISIFRKQYSNIIVMSTINRSIVIDIINIDD